jgi:hypothetical protein
VPGSFGPVCEHLFVTSEGHPHAVFRRALERRSVAAAWAAAAGLPQLTLADALALSLLVRDREPHRYDRVAVRWLARFCDEEAGVQLDEATLIAAHLAAFRAPAPLAAARSFAELLDAHGRRQLAQAVRRWEIELAAHAQPGRAAR